MNPMQVNQKHSLTHIPILPFSHTKSFSHSLSLSLSLSVSVYISLAFSNVFFYAVTVRERRFRSTYNELGGFNI